MTAMPDQRAAAGQTQPVGVQARKKQGFTLWPLWATLAGGFTFAGTAIFDVRPEAELEAWERGEDYIVSPADMMGLDGITSRFGWTAGVIGVALLLVFAAVWWRHTQRFTDSVAAKIVVLGLVATAGAASLGYGWKGALANYLGPEAGLYDERGLFVYYMLTDFGAFLPWLGVLVAALAVAWMAFAERLVSRVLGTVSALFGLGLTALMLISGVPGIPGTLMPGWLIITGIWLAVGRSRITEKELGA